MKRLITIAIISLCVLALSNFSAAADVELSWDPNPELDIAGYKVYQSLDVGQNWAVVADTNATNISLHGISDTGLILFRVSAYDNQDESIRHNAGAWFNNDWVLISNPKSSGIR